MLDSRLNAIRRRMGFESDGPITEIHIVIIGGDGVVEAVLTGSYPLTSKRMVTALIATKRSSQSSLIYFRDCASSKRLTSSQNKIVCACRQVSAIEAYSMPTGRHLARLD